MKKKKIVEFNGVVYTTRFVHYNDQGEVFGIGGLPDQNFKNFEIKIDLIPNFVSLKKNYRIYNIDYFVKIAEGLITDEEEIEDADKNNLIPFEVLFEQNKNAELSIVHDATNKQWVVSSTAYKNKLETISSIPLYITIKNNYNFLLSSYSINTLDLIDKQVTLDFLTDVEQDINSISILTVKKFRSYSVGQV